MSRFEKKCYIGSAALHGLLAVCFVFGSAFLASKEKPNSGGTIRIVSLPESPLPASAPPPPRGNPIPQPTPPEPEPPQPKPPEPKAEPQPTPPEPKPQVRKPEPEKEKERGNVPVVSAKPPKDKPKQIASTPTPLPYKVVRRTNTVVDVAALNAQRLQRERDARQRAAAIAAREQAISEATGVINGLGKTLSQSTVVTSAGIDTSGGMVSGRYSDSLKAIYDARWTLNNELTDDESVASVCVTVARNGTVKSARITRPSGSATFDRSVQRVLDSVRTVQPFPPEMKDSEREFTWRFSRKMRMG